MNRPLAEHVWNEMRSNPYFSTTYLSEFGKHPPYMCGESKTESWKEIESLNHAEAAEFLRRILEALVESEDGHDA